MNKFVLPLLMLMSLVCAGPLAAKGTQEKDFQEAQGKDNFSQSVDLSGLVPGQYNILVRTKDAAGNVSYAGPFNFYYDPSSDNPLINVANPVPGQRLGSSLNIVGISSAPKGTALVEVQVDTGEWQPAKGQGFWSYFLDTTGMPDGPHELTVRGTDVNGLVGPSVTVPFQLDQFLPAFTLNSHKSGERVSGVISLEGTLADGNGLKSLDLSTDDRKTTTPINLQGGSSSLSRNFQYTLDTRAFADGPLVLWFRGVDGQGSEIRRAILLYVDNTVPQVRVLSPAPGVGLHGKTRFAVLADKSLGIRSLAARVGDQGEPVNIPVVPGNPYHIVDLALPSDGSGSVSVIFEAVDTSGKVGRTVYQAKLNGDTDLPVVTLADDLTKLKVQPPFHLVGNLKATDGPQAVAWSLNGSPEIVQTAGASFDFVVPGLVSGTNKLTFTGIDANNKRGKASSVSFTAVLPAPTVAWTSVVLPDQEIPFRPGVSVAPDKKAKVKATISWGNALKAVSWTFGDGKILPVTVPATAAGKDSVVQLSLPDDPPFGLVELSLTATDTFDQTTTISSWIDVANLAKAQGPEGLVFADQRVGNSPLVISPETPLRGYFVGGKIRSADLLTSKGTVPGSVLQVTHDDNYVTIKDLKDGQFDTVKLRVVNDKGRVYDLDLGTVLGDTAAPFIGLSSPLSGSWVRGNLKIEGQVSDNNGLTRLEWSIDNGRSWQQLDPPSGQGGPFTRQFDLPGPDNMVNLLIRATDTAGRTGTVLTVVRRDTQGPSIELTMPTLAPGTKGKITVVGRIRDEGAVKSAETTIAKKNFSLPVDRPFTLDLDATVIAGIPLFFRAVDWAGNASEINFTVPFSPAPDPNAPPPVQKPEIQILFPKGDVKGLNGPVPVVGRVVGFTSAPQLSVKGEATGDQVLDLSDAGFFSFSADLSAIKSKALTFAAVGAAKEAASLSYSLPYDAASELPQARFLPQTEKPILTGNVSASGWIGDSRGTVSWWSQLDGGEKKVGTPDPAKGPVGVFLVDLGVPALGPHKLTVVPVNAQGKEGPPATTEFVSTQPSGPVEFTNIDLGAPLVIGKDSRVQGRITSINTWRRLEIRFADLLSPDGWNGAFQPLTAAKAGDTLWTFDVPIPQNLPFSRIGVIVRGEDSLGQKVEGRTIFHRVWMKEAASIADNEGLFFLDGALDRLTGRFTTVPNQPLVGAFRGRPIKAVSLSTNNPALTVSFDGNKVLVNAKEEGIFGPFSASVTTIDNETFTSPPLTLFADTSGPLLDWENPLNSDWTRDTVPVSGKVSDPSGVASLEVSTDGGFGWVPVPVKNGIFNTSVPLAVGDGLIRVVLKAVDKGGHVTIDSRAVTKDTAAPTWTVVAPPEDRKINGLTTLIGLASDDYPVTSVEFSDDGKTYKPTNGTGLFAFDVDFAKYAKVPDKLYLRTTDAAGNQGVQPLLLPLDQEADKPVVQIQTPADQEVVRSDFVIGGMAFDDDGVKSLSWRLDGGTWLKLDGVSSFQIPVALATLTDNEHTVEVQAEDIYGTKGNVFKSTFKVSLDAPAALLFTPEIDKTVSGVVGLVGASFDRNGVQSVQMSLDNGLTWNKAEIRKAEQFLPTSNLQQAKDFLPAQRQEWEWRFDSRTLKDGTYLVMVKTTDNYGTPGLYTTLVNIDNEVPALTLTSPADGAQVLDSIELEGRSSDNILLVSLRAELRPIETTTTGTKAAAQAAVLQTDLPVTPTFNVPWNIGTLNPGWYNLRLEARDQAGNSKWVARNIRVEGASADKVQILYPQAGETVSGSFLLEGKVTSRTKVDTALINLDGKTKVVVPVDDQGYFENVLDGSLLEQGEHGLVVTVQVTPTVTLTSEVRKVLFDPQGPWVRVQSHRTGAYVTQRPWITGTAGWNAAPLDPGATIEETLAYNKAQDLHKVVSVEGSLDNGMTFAPAQGTEEWKFRLETLPIPDGPLPLLFRARYKDGSVAIQRLLVNVAQTPPKVELLTNFENGRFNGTLDLAGFTDGNVKSVEVALRPGDKAGYEVPSFIQGMYWDSHFLGASYWEQGLGLTFFQDNVKLQAKIGMSPDTRFSGTMVGAKLIANVAALPGGYFFGPDWAWLSSSFGVGADFSLMSNTPTFGDFKSAQGTLLGGVVTQWEVAKATLKDRTFFKSYSFYVEGTTWFISSDVQAEALWQTSLGVRVGLF